MTYFSQILFSFSYRLGQNKHEVFGGSQIVLVVLLLPPEGMLCFQDFFPPSFLWSRQVGPELLLQLWTISRDVCLGHTLQVSVVGLLGIFSGMCTVYGLKCCFPSSGLSGLPENMQVGWWL